MTAFSPFDNKDYDNMSLPYAFYEISMANSGDRDAKVSLRFVFPEDVKTWAVASDCTGEKTIRKGGTATARFVVAWYDHTDPELAHYKNLYASPQPIAEHGLEVFPQLKHNAVRLADGMRSSSLPHWLQNQVANTLSAIVINSMYKRDGRVAFAEGQWTCFGTMDQMWLARTGVLGAHADEERADSPRHEPHGRGQRKGEAVGARGLGRHRAPRLPRHTEVGRPELWLHHLCIRGLPHHGRPRELPQAVAQHEAGRRQDKGSGGAAGQQGVSADLRRVGKLLRRRGQPRPVQRQHIRRGLQDNGGAVGRDGRGRQGRRAHSRVRRQRAPRRRRLGNNGCHRGVAPCARGTDPRFLKAGLHGHGGIARLARRLRPPARKARGQAPASVRPSQDRPWRTGRRPQSQQRATAGQGRTQPRPHRAAVQRGTLQRALCHRAACPPACKASGEQR